MFERSFGKVLAYLVMAGALILLIVFGAFMLECASWGQCPPVSGFNSKHQTQNVQPQ
jgi:hypothetical protein